MPFGCQELDNKPPSSVCRVLFGLGSSKWAQFWAIAYGKSNIKNIKNIKNMRENVRWKGRMYFGFLGACGKSPVFRGKFVLDRNCNLFRIRSHKKAVVSQVSKKKVCDLAVNMESLQMYFLIWMVQKQIDFSRI